MITYVQASGSQAPHLVVKPVGCSNPQRNMIRLPGSGSNTAQRSLPQPPRSLPMPPTYRQSPLCGSNSLIRAPSTSLLSNRSVYSVNKPNPTQTKSSQQQNPPSASAAGSQQNGRHLPQPKQRYYHQAPVAVLPQTPSPKMHNKPSSNLKPISPYIVSVNSPPEPTSPSEIINSSGSNVSTGSSSSQSSSESSSGPGAASNAGPKYTRVPPPRYRPHQPPLAQRRPLSGGPYQQQQHPQQQQQQPQNNSGLPYHHGQGGSNLRQNRYGGKSVSAESVLVQERQQQYNGTMKTSSGGSSSRSSSPNSGSNSESQLTPEDSPRRQGDHQRNSRIGIPQGPMRRSSGLRMWQGHMAAGGAGHPPRSNVAPGGQRPPQQQQPPPPPSEQARKQSSRSPSPGGNR